MLPARHRLRRSPDFRAAVRGGRRAGGRYLVVHLLTPPAQVPPGNGGGPAPATAGLVVSKGVGGAVVRTRVKRRLRHLLADRIHRLPDGARLVVRATPAAATATSAELGADLDGGLDRGLGAAGRPPRRTRGAR